MSNLLKSFSLICNEDKRIIDSNEAVTERLQQIRSRVMAGDKGGFSLGIKPENVESLLSEDEQETACTQAEAAMTDGQLQIMTEQMLSEARAKAKNIMDMAQSDAMKIVDDAVTEAARIKKKAYSEGLEAGRAEGRKNVSDELARLDAEYKEKTESLESEYSEKLDRMEPELVDVMVDVFADVTRVLSADQRDMILALVDKTLKGTEASNNYIIKACREDAAFLRENKEHILRDINRDINLEIVEDMTMKRNECLIDTDFGIYDCGLDIQLENLIRSIKILSCTAEK